MYLIDGFLPIVQKLRNLMIKVRLGLRSFLHFRIIRPSEYRVVTLDQNVSSGFHVLDMKNLYVGITSLY